jgi:hypothetical protein
MTHQSDAAVPGTAGFAIIFELLNVRDYAQRSLNKQTSGRK